MRILWLCLALGVVLIWANPSDAACTGSGTAWSCPAGATPIDVNSAITRASDGATISFAAGAYTWGNTSINFDNAKGVTLDGRSQSALVTITTPGLTIAMNGTVSGDNTKQYRVTGFTFQNAPATTVFWFYGRTGAILNNLRFDHNTFSNFDAGSMVALLGANGPFSTIYGLFDHNLLTGSVNFQLVKTLGVGDPTQISSSVRGTIKNTFVEDNVFDFATMRSDTLGAGCVDVWDSASMVFRHNSTRNCMVTAHGVLHGGGAMNFELYSNTLKMDSGSVVPNGYRLFHHQGSGEFLAYHNTFVHSTSPINVSAMEIIHYRSASCTDAGYDCSRPRCDGNNPNTDPWKDGRRSPLLTYRGYQCWYQPGRAPNGGSNPYGTLSPMYTWQNIDLSTGNKVPLTINNSFPGPPFVTDHIKPNRDYYDAVSKDAQTSSTSPFNGTTGMGFGTLANRPTTCTTGSAEEPGLGGVGYWATDTNTLYRCSSTNTWIEEYTPFTYPHPLQTGGGGGDVSAPVAPSNLTVH